MISSSPAAPQKPQQGFVHWHNWAHLEEKAEGALLKGSLQKALPLDEGFADSETPTTPGREDGHWISG